MRFILSYHFKEFVAVSLIFVFIFDFALRATKGLRPLDPQMCCTRIPSFPL